MNEDSNISGYTLAGLVIAGLGAQTIIFISEFFVHEEYYSNVFVTWRELIICLLGIALLAIIVKGEKQTLNSIGLNNKKWKRSLLIIITGYIGSVIVAFIAILFLRSVGIGDEDVNSKLNRYKSVSPLIKGLMLVRAGFIEELFFRGYLMERLNKLSNHWVVYFFFPALIFGLSHYALGVRGMVVAFALGISLGIIYWKYRDLKANVIIHFTLDLISMITNPK